MNNFQFNQSQFNQGYQYNDTQVYPISFNGYNLMSLCGGSSGVIIQSMNAFDLTNIDLTSFVSSISDGGGVINKKYQNKNISMELFIQGTSYYDLILKIDELKNKTQGIEGNLDILVDGEVRRYSATVSSISVPSIKKTVDYVEGISLELLITSPHWMNPVYAQTYVQNMTTDFTKLVVNKGTYKTYPIVQVITNPSSVINGLSITHQRVGELTGYTIDIDEIIPENSVVKFDFVNKEVLVNDVEVNFTGIMMPLEIGQSIFSFVFSGTPDVNVYVLHNPTFL